LKGDYIFMLASWFPNKLEPTSGNFVQSHVRAIGINNKVIVFYLKFVDRKLHPDSYRGEDKEELVGNILYIKKYIVKPNSSLTKFFIYYNYCLHIFKQYGMPKFIQVHVGWPTALVAWLLKKLKKIPYIITEHNSRYLQVNTPRLHLFEKQIFKNAEGITCVSKHLSDDVQQLFDLKTLPTLIPNLIDDELYDIPKHIEKERYFIHVSNFAPVKQSIKIVEAFIKVLTQMPDYKLYMYGEDGEDKEACKNMAQQHGLLFRSIFIESIIPRQEVLEKMSKATALVSYSLYETQGITVYEALAVHCPVICNNIVSFQELVKPQFGVLVNNDSELCDAMINIVQGKHHCNFANYNEKYDSNTINKLFNNFYKELKLA